MHNEVRVYSKRQSCIFCRKFVSKLSSHFEAYKDECDVQSISKLPKGGKKRKDAIAQKHDWRNYISERLLRASRLLENLCQTR